MLTYQTVTYFLIRTGRLNSTFRIRLLWPPDHVIGVRDVLLRFIYLFSWSEISEKLHRQIFKGWLRFMVQFNNTVLIWSKFWWGDPQGGVLYTKIALSRKQYKTEPWLLWNANYRNSLTLYWMTLSDPWPRLYKVTIFFNSNLYSVTNYGRHE